jgi:hypothetical protein
VTSHRLTSPESLSLDNTYHISVSPVVMQNPSCLLRWLIKSVHIADAILKSSLDPPIALQGLAIGNGWIDPREQYQGYVDFAYEKGMIKAGTAVSLHYALLRPLSG